VTFLFLSASVALARDLTFDERVDSQEAIERVRYAHRIGATKPFEKAVPRAVLEWKVREYLRLSDDLGGTVAVTPAMLQREVERIEVSTRNRAELDELFAALGNDPVRIAECLARPALVARLSWFVDESTAPDTTLRVEFVESVCTPDVWTALPTAGAPSARTAAKAVWTGNEMIVWGGLDSVGALSTGGAYDPVLDSWRALSNAGAPTARSGHTAVWTGSEMIVWGGYATATGYANTGGRYDPVADVWTATSVTGVPVARGSHAAVWTGSRMIVWGGKGSATQICEGELGDGASYDPATDGWSGIALPAGLYGRYNPIGIWTGSEMIVWGGQSETRFQSFCIFDYPTSGGRYNPVTDTWNLTSLPGSLGGSTYPKAVWTGSRMFVWSGGGATYDPATNTWSLASSPGSPAVTGVPSLVWTGSEAILWGDNSSGQPVGAMYDPATDTWVATESVGAPQGRSSHAAVWTGDDMLVWGGSGGGGQLGDGARYTLGDPDSDGDGLCKSEDPCDVDPANDADGDGRCANSDNCPSAYNPTQADGDGDKVGDACDACPLDANNDSDHDGVCGNVDNCNGRFNPTQSDLDGDGLGDLCDTCPYDADPTDADGDSDGLGDVCDCQPTDSNDRRPQELGLTVSKAGSKTELAFFSNYADAFLLTRGNLSTFRTGDYGSCLAVGAFPTGNFQDAAVPAPGTGFFYLVQGQSYDCGVGPLGITSAGTEIVNSNPAACVPLQVLDAFPVSETTVLGTVTGTYQDTLASDDVYETITEVLSGGVSQLDHRWTIEVPAGSAKYFHYEGLKAPSADDYQFSYSTDGGAHFRSIAISGPPTVHTNDNDAHVTIPASVTGTVIVRVIDNNRVDQTNDWVSIDQLWIRVVP
jgi:hypothetical protein